MLVLNPLVAPFPLSNCPLHLLGTKLFSASCTHSAGSCPREAALPQWHLVHGNSRVRNGQRLPRVLHHSQKHQTRLLVFDNKQCMRSLAFAVCLILYFLYSCTSTHTSHAEILPVRYSCNITLQCKKS